jgi:F-type H+-transporting ATPase subunit delta
MSALPFEATVEGYARGIFEIARAEGALDRVENELFTFARAAEANTGLREQLADERLPMGDRLGLIAAVLAAGGGRAHSQTTAALCYIVLAGRARQLVEILDRVVRMAAESRNQSVAQVRSAVDLDADQRQRLAAALSRAAGKAVSLKVIVDPRVVGGVVASVDDTVIDGSVATRLAELRAGLVGG